MARAIEAWSSLVGPGLPMDIASATRRAVRLEQDGWDGCTIVDSQLAVPDSYVTLACCAGATTRIKLGTGTSNPATRHPSVIANAAASLQVASAGRMTLSLGRGDTSLLYIGGPPVSLRYFESSVRMVREYLHGNAVEERDASEFLSSTTHLRSSDDAENLQAQLSWAGDTYRPPELALAASGPKVIRLSARYADRIAFALGADVERLRWAVTQAREAAEQEGRDPAELRFAAYIPLFPHKDIQYAQELARITVMLMSRYTGATGTASQEPEQDAGSEAKFMDSQCLYGESDRCIDRIMEIAELGIDKFMFWSPDTELKAGESYASAVDVISKIRR